MYGPSDAVRDSFSDRVPGFIVVAIFPGIESIAFVNIYVNNRHRQSHATATLHLPYERRVRKPGAGGLPDTQNAAN